MSSLILRTAMRLIFPLALLFAAYMALKGHDEPGGGFIGGLIGAVALALYRMAEGAEAMRNLVPVHPRLIVVSGMGIALLTVLAPMFFGEPALRTYNRYIELPGGDQAHFSSALFFDVGVLLVVVGVSIGMIIRLSEEVEQ